MHAIALSAASIAAVLGAVEFVALDVHKLKDRFICPGCHKLRLAATRPDS